MIDRPLLIQQVKDRLQQKSILWMSSVRRVGKTTLCKTIPDAVYFDCELPSVRIQLEDPEYFWRQHSTGLVILDEIHRLSDPSNVLKIAAKRKFKTPLCQRLTLILTDNGP